MEINKKEITKLLKELGTYEDKLHRRILTGALKAGAGTIKKAAQQYVPFGDGDLQDSIKVKRGSGSKHNRKQGFKRTDSVYYVGIDTSQGHYANIIEFGSKHVQADPFMTPAYELQNHNVLHAAKHYIKRRIDKINKLKAKNESKVPK